MTDIVERLRKGSLLDSGNERVARWTMRDAAYEIDQLRVALTELVAMVRGECPALLNEDSGGNGHLSVKIDELLANAPQ